MQFFLLTTLFVSAAVAMPNLLSTRNDDACVGKVNGVLVATNTCNSFVTCFNGAGTVHNCEQGKLFNETIGQCDWAMNVNCEEHVGTPQGPAPNCHGRYGQMLRNPYDCSSFYRCEHNAALLFHCDEGLYFDTTINNCNWKQNVVCRIDDMPVDEGAPDCFGKDWSYFPNYLNCGTYYRCENDAPVLYSCPESLLFDPHVLTCNWAPSVQCY